MHSTLSQKLLLKTAVFLFASLSLISPTIPPVFAETIDKASKPAIEQKQEQVKIIGDEKFKKSVEAALTLLREKAPEAHKLLLENTRVIELNKKLPSPLSNLSKSSIILDQKTADYYTEWLASQLAHEAYHLYKHNKRLKERDPLILKGEEMTKEEKECFSFQIQVLEKIKSGETDPSEINFLNKLIAHTAERQRSGEHWKALDKNNDGTLTQEDFAI